MDTMGVTPTMPLFNQSEGFGGSAWIMILLVIILLGGGSFGFGGRSQAATTDELSAGFNFSGINNKLNELTAGQASINQNLGNAISTSTYELASKIDNCCCNTQLAVKDLMATVVAEGSATRNLIQENKIDSLQSQVNQLQLAQAMCGVPKVSPYAYGTYQYPCFSGACGYTTM